VGAAIGLIGVATLPGCSNNDVGTIPDAGGPDAGGPDASEAPQSDGGALADSGLNPDAGDLVDAGQSPDAGDLTDTGIAPDAGDLECDPTVAQAEGPFGQDGLERSNLNLYGHTGVQFSISGRVMDLACRPIPNAQVLLWHATPSPADQVPRTLTEDTDYTAAVYDHPAEAGQTTPDGQTVPTNERMYYGWMNSDAEGRYRFESLRPGWYLNGATYRASHLHVQVLVAGQVRLTSQIYFPDDPFNARDGIFLDCTPTGSCTMAIDGQGAAAYDLVLDV
jgi:protocatechuate 3,4-dioxygenase beta subunit